MEALSTPYRDAVPASVALPFALDQIGLGDSSAPRVRAVDRIDEGRPSLANGAAHRAQRELGARAFDIGVALLAILVFLPFLILTALAITLSGPGPVLFIQPRVGRNGQTFPCLKFRSMVVDSQDVLEDLLARSTEARMEWERDQKLRCDPRITQVGAILRKTSLDELPQLFNILAGHMSVVGPRPIIAAEIPRYGPRFEAYCSVRPGLTGLWQVSGRNEVRYEARVRLDALYARRKSTWYDMAICLRTIPAVLASRGVY
ncbi:sugar transferase [Novosphingobium soli]|uniref:Sugar transferase n=1 Tax=Novosphingobium soli TaxID=574956 RepID=A0ABV6CV27_9SPHN